MYSQQIKWKYKYALYSCCKIGNSIALLNQFLRIYITNFGWYGNFCFLLDHLDVYFLVFIVYALNCLTKTNETINNWNTFLFAVKQQIFALFLRQTIQNSSSSPFEKCSAQPRNPRRWRPMSRHRTTKETYQWKSRRLKWLKIRLVPTYDPNFQISWNEELKLL